MYVFGIASIATSQENTTLPPGKGIHATHTRTPVVLFSFFGVKVDHPMQQWQHTPIVHDH